jgi:hypothetical protein
MSAGDLTIIVLVMVPIISIGILITIKKMFIYSDKKQQKKNKIASTASYQVKSIKLTEEDDALRGPFYKYKLTGLKDVVDELPDKLTALSFEKYDNLSAKLRSRPFKRLANVEEAIDFIPKKLEELAEYVKNNLAGINFLRASYTITGAPGLAIAIWRHFHDGSSDGLLNIVIKNEDNSYTFIWTP